MDAKDELINAMLDYMSEYGRIEEFKQHCEWYEIDLEPLLEAIPEYISYPLKDD